MDDKQRIKLLKMIIASQVFGSACLFVGALAGQNALKKSLNYQIEQLKDANDYNTKIVEVLQPTNEQIDRINMEFDLEKWDNSIA
jgi:hypothetical protein